MKERYLAMSRRKTEVKKVVMQEPRRLAEMLNSTQKSTQQITANFNAAMQAKAKPERSLSKTTPGRRSES